MERQNEKAANRRRAKMPGPRIRSDATDANKLGNDRDGPDCTGRRVSAKTATCTQAYERRDFHPMESHRTHQLISYEIQARPGAYVADSARGAIL